MLVTGRLLKGNVFATNIPSKKLTFPSPLNMTMNFNTNHSIFILLYPGPETFRWQFQSFYTFIHENCELRAVNKGI